MSTLWLVKGPVPTRECLSITTLTMVNSFARRTERFLIRSMVSNTCHAQAMAPWQPSPFTLTQLWGAKRLVEIEGGANQGKVRKSLGEIPQRLPAGPDLLGIEPQVVRVAQHLLKDVPG